MLLLQLPRHGVPFYQLNLDFQTDNTTVQEATKGNITNLAKDLSVASFDIEFVEPNRTFLEVETIFQFNPYLTSSSQTAIETSVGQTMKNYFD